MIKRVATLAEAAAALQACEAEELELWSPENAAEIQGVMWFVMLQRALNSAFPDRQPRLVLDCGNRGDLAVEAFRNGLKDVALAASPGVTAKVADVALSCGGRIIQNPIYP
ncbi:MAG: hypothetical protein IPK59_04580 [Rhodospirillaceae bacterium]|nr:hypothetical protein [Rhodospirillaceae bacterium]